MRAYARQSQEDYQEGLDYANEYTAKKSQDVDGYLLSANMYLLNNQRDAALNVYRRGVIHGDRQHPQYHNLVMRKDRLEEDMKRLKTHLINLLPREVIHMILSYLARRDLIRLAKTCRPWYALVMDWPGLWSEFTITTDDVVYPNTRFLAQVPAQHLRKLEHSIGDPDFAYMTQQLFDMIADLKWNWLEELGMYSG